MNFSMVLLCLLFAVMLAGGQLLFKLGADVIAARGEVPLIQAALSPYLLAALALYGATTLLWIYILSRLPLSVAYPFSLLGSLLVPLMALALLRESLDLRYAIGFAIMVVGLVIANFR